MLSVKSFMSGIELLKKCYIGWQFDTKDEIQVKLWYSSFKNLTDEQFKNLIKDYYAHYKQPPKCVRDLTEILVDKFYATAKIPPERALETIRDIVNKNGGWEYGRADIYKDLSKCPGSLIETVREFESSLRLMTANDTYTAERFRKAYAIRLRASAIREVDKRLGLSFQDGSKQLGSGESSTIGRCLPYEE